MECHIRECRMIKSNRKINQHTKGFTLIELIAVIVILSVLAATAAPRFMGLQRSARIAVMEGMYAEIISAVDLFRLGLMMKVPYDMYNWPYSSSDINPICNTAMTGSAANIYKYCDIDDRYVEALIGCTGTGVQLVTDERNGIRAAIPGGLKSNSTFIQCLIPSLTVDTLMGNIDYDRAQQIMKDTGSQFIVAHIGNTSTNFEIGIFYGPSFSKNGTLRDACYLVFNAQNGSDTSFTTSINWFSPDDGYRIENEDKC